MKKILALALVIFGIGPLTSRLQAAEPVHALSRYGSPKYSASFRHFNYVNPQAPKGGTFRQAVIGQFDSVNPYIDRGVAASGSHLLFDTLLARSWDEPLSKYGLLAEKIELDTENNWVAFHINPGARFADQSPVTAEDVKYSFDLLRQQGSTFYRHFYRDVDRVEVSSRLRVLFIFKHNNNPELALILGQMPVFSRHSVARADFSKSGLAHLNGSGPYQISHIDSGRVIHFSRRKDYWGYHLPVNRGRHNFDTLIYEYYKDATVAREALLNSEYDMAVISDPSQWPPGLTNRLLANGKMVQSTLSNGNPLTTIITYNTRSRFLRDHRVRESLGYGMDFISLNQRLYRSLYNQADSYFAGTELASSGLPDAGELKLLAPFRQQLPLKLFHESFNTRMAGTDRKARTQALSLLKSAGFQIRNNKQFSTSGDPLVLNALARSHDDEKVFLAFRDRLSHLGITLKVQQIDPLQYIERIRHHDFDLIIGTYRHTPSPGTEILSQWGSIEANLQGSKNLSGVRSEVVDALALAITRASSRTELVAATRALDRVLLWGHYGLPLRYLPEWRVLHKPYLKYPQQPATYALDLSTWWYQQSP